MTDHCGKRWVLASTIIVALVLSGCAGTVKNMQTFGGDPASITPEPGKAMMVFLRPSTLGFAIQSSVFRVDVESQDIVGIVAAKAKVAYQVDPGEHLFMVVGESADFMYADVEAGKTYYALVTPRMGAWKARFSLAPVARPDQDRTQLDEWLGECSWVEKSPETEAWAAENKVDIEDKKTRYYLKWMEKDEADRPRLTLEDGVL
jgi:hypothetical protein